jgi:hypothetical protein
VLFFVRFLAGEIGDVGHGGMLVEWFELEPLGFEAGKVGEVAG